MQIIIRETKKLSESITKQLLKLTEEIILFSKKKSG